MPYFSDIFEWDEWDDFDYTVFYECVLLRDVGSFKMGDEFSTIIWNEEKLTLKFYTDSKEPVMVKKLGLID